MFRQLISLRPAVKYVYDTASCPTGQPSKQAGLVLFQCPRSVPVLKRTLGKARGKKCMKKRLFMMLTLKVSSAERFKPCLLLVGMTFPRSQ